jgi:hypothetical protein
MANNPLQQYFRQPKIYIKLPSGGVFNKLGTLQGDVTNMPVYGMTGMDEIIMKTPDALMSGEAAVRVIQSCCPNIKDAWELSNVDTEQVLAAIRIATYGNEIEVSSKCKECGADNEYTLDLSKLIEHFNKFQYNNIVEISNLRIKIQPLTYKLGTTFSLRNYELQKQLQQALTIENDAEQTQVVNDIFVKLSDLQNEIFFNSIDSVETSTETVTDRGFIKEWISNCDKVIFDELKHNFNKNRDALKAPPFIATCESCSANNEVYFNLDETNFFVSA